MRRTAPASVRRRPEPGLPPQCPTSYPVEMASNALEPASLGVSPDPRRTRTHRLLTWGLFVLIVGGGAFVIKTHQTVYSSSGTVLMVGPESLAQREASGREVVDAAAQSGLARFGDPTVVGDIFARIYSSWAKQQELSRDGLRGKLTVTTRSSVASSTPDHGPVIVFTVVSSDPMLARDGVNMVLADVDRELHTMQRGSDPSLSVNDVKITVPTLGQQVSGSRPRSAVAVVTFGALLAWLVGQLDLLRRARLRRSAAATV